MQRTVKADTNASEQLLPGKLPRARLKKMRVSPKFEKTRDLDSMFNRSEDPSPHTKIQHFLLGEDRENAVLC